LKIEKIINKTFTNWNGNKGINEFIKKKTGCSPFSGSGINIRINKNTAILRSVDYTYYYDDDLTNINNVEYTLFGHYGDQDQKEKRFNEPFLNPEKVKYIYLYRVKRDEPGNIKNQEYIWYGKYEIVRKYKKRHIDKDKKIRNIIMVSLRKI
jgi:hypothetical protein